MHDRQRTLESLKALRRERASSSPFTDHTEFLRWADQAAPLLAFSQPLAEELASCVRAATAVQDWRPEKYVPAINSAIGAVNQAITLLEHAAAPGPHAPSQTSVPPQAAEPKVTLKWVFEHASLAVYASLFGALVISFGLGREVGKLETQMQSNALSKPAPTTTAPTSTIRNSIEPARAEVKSHNASAPK